MSRPSWDSIWLAQVQLTAQMSTCLTRKVGAIVVRDRRLIATGFNGNVPGAVHCVDGGCERCARKLALTELYQWPAGTKLGECTCVHAEVNAVAQCARYGSPTAGTTVYCTTKPCLDCIKLLASAGVVAVVYDEDYPVSYEVPPTLTLKEFGQ